MPIVESLYVPVLYRATELGCAMPENIAILPDNFCEANSRLELMVRAESVTLRNLFENASAPLENFFPLGEHIVTGHRDGLAWEACLFVPTSGPDFRLSDGPLQRASGPPDQAQRVCLGEASRGLQKAYLPRRCVRCFGYDSSHFGGGQQIATNIDAMFP